MPGILLEAIKSSQPPCDKISIFQMGKQRGCFFKAGFYSKTQLPLNNCLIWAISSKAVVRATGKIPTVGIRNLGFIKWLCS